jgi:uncharacterized protein YodC (DUF2158 family)
VSKFLEVGQVVTLKSGGPNMTINKIDDYHETVECVWFTAESAYSLSWNDMAVGTFGFNALRPAIL